MKMHRIEINKEDGPRVVQILTQKQDKAVIQYKGPNSERRMFLNDDQLLLLDEEGITYRKLGA